MPATATTNSLVMTNVMTDNFLDSQEQATAPGTPTTGRVRLYSSSAGDRYAKDDTGAATQLTHARQSILWYIENPTTSDDYVAKNVPVAATIDSVIHKTDQGTVDFNVEKRAKLTPDSAGTNLFAADEQATNTGQEETTFNSAGITAQQWLHLDISATAGGPTKVWIAVRYHFT